MLGRRPDAVAITGLSPMRRIMPFVSPGRNDSAFYLASDVEVEAALELVEKCNRERPPERPVTLFHLLLRSLSQVLALRPGVNRFVRAGRLWQHDGISLSFAAKRELREDAPMATIKRRFSPRSETLDEMVDGVYERLTPARRGVETTSDKETKLLLRLPPVFTGLLVRAGDWLDHFGLMPRAMIDADPLFTSIFVANLGSVGLEGGFHHLWERGTCSVFCVMGRVKPGPAGRRIITLYYTYDERIDDGLYAFTAVETIKGGLEDPQRLLASVDDLAPLGRIGSVPVPGAER